MNTLSTTETSYCIRQKSGARLALIAGVVSLVTVLFSTASYADTTTVSDYPKRAIKLIVPFPTGGPNDTSSRVFAAQLSGVLKQNVYVENVVGAGGRIGSKAAAKATPDGYTLMVGSTNLIAVLPALNKNLDYSPSKDFIPIAAFSSDSLIMAVSPNLPVKNVQEFIAYAKAHPKTISAGGAIGIAPHFAIEMFKRRTDTDILFVPYKGGGPVIQDLLGGHIQMTFNNKSALLPYLQAGKVRAIGVTSEKRQAELPDVATMQESGVTGVPSTSYYGLMAPTGTPKAIVDTLRKAVAAVVASPAAQKSFANLGIDYDVGNIDFATILAQQTKEWDTIVKETGIKAD